MLIAVSSMQIWHGYERILEGMYVYYKEVGEYDIRLKFVGNGPEEQKYKNLVREYGLQSKVEFLGRIESWDTERLNEQYALSDMAVGSLGMYKAGYSALSPIKGSEYCAKGLPFICGYHDLRFPVNWEFILNVPNEQTPVDMRQIIEFYERVTSKKNYKKEMRDFALNNLTWERIMIPVVNFLNQ